MRERRLWTVIAFDTTTAAMAMEEAAGKCGFPGRLIPLPGEISAGCGLAWKCVEQEEMEAELFLKENKLEFKGIYRILL